LCEADILGHSSLPDNVRPPELERDVEQVPAALVEYMRVGAVGDKELEELQVAGAAGDLRGLLAVGLVAVEANRVAEWLVPGDALDDVEVAVLAGDVEGGEAVQVCLVDVDGVEAEQGLDYGEAVVLTGYVQRRVQLVVCALEGQLNDLKE